MDYRKVNGAIKKNVCLRLFIDETLGRLSLMKDFIKLDIQWAFFRLVWPRTGSI